MPRLYDAEVMHARLRPKRHDFTHAAFALAVDAAALESTRGGRFMLGRRFSPYRFRDRDFLPAAEIFQPEGVPQDFGKAGDKLAGRFRAFVAAQGEPLPERAEITLLAMPRAFGKSYNPAVFMMATVDGELACGVAEVHNTFGERKAWFLGKACLKRDYDGDAYLQLRTPKRFYVSPFSKLETEFEFTLRLPDGQLAITVDHYEGGDKTLTSAWTGKQAEITLLAMPRAFGKSYNPAVFMMATVDGELACGVAEVHNTFGERKAWFLGKACLKRDYDGDAYLQLRTPKRFYVSPFSKLETEFEFTLRLPDGQLAITVDHYEGGDKTLTSAWTGKQVPLTDLRLLWLTVKSPLLILKVIALIHLHAAWLWLVKKLPFRRKGDDIPAQRNLRHPTPELTGRHD